MENKNLNDDDDLGKFMANFKAAVAATGMTPHFLSKKVGVDKMAVSRLLKNCRDAKLSTVIRIVKGMRVSVYSGRKDPPFRLKLIHRSGLVIH